MDAFLSDINAGVFYQWILDHPVEGCTYRFEEDKKWQVRYVYIDNDQMHAEVRFNPLNIIEFEVEEKRTGETAFYLHFQMNNLNHAASLYDEFTGAIANLNKKKVLKVLLSCSGGMTTSYFANILNEGAGAINLDYEFNATPYYHLFHEGDAYDVILLAPQISFNHAQVKSVLRNQLVIDIPPAVFAKYDVAEMLAVIRVELEKDAMRKRLPVDIGIRRDIHNPVKSLVISIVRHTGQVRLCYRLDDKDKLVESNEIIKQVIDINDIDDIVSVAMASHPDIAVLGITAPGVINDGYVDCVRDNLAHVQMKGYFEDKYHIPVLVSNDVNAIAVGLYATQEVYENISFYFQPRGTIYAGIGNVIGGKLHTGWKNLSGEVQYLPEYAHPEGLDEDIKTTEGTLNLVSRNLCSEIALVAPDVIYVYCDLIPDMDELKQAIARTIPEAYIPEFVKSIHLKDYMLLGQMILCAQMMEESTAR